MTSKTPTWRQSAMVPAFALVALQSMAETPKAPGPAAAAVLASAAHALPDLVLEGPEDKVDAPGLISVSITVRNAGGKDSTKATSLRSQCVTEAGSEPRCETAGGWQIGFVMEKTYSLSVPPLHKGESVVILAAAYYAGGGDYRVRFTMVVDPDNLVVESNENNNTATFTRSRQPGVAQHPAGGFKTIPQVSTPTPK